MESSSMNTENETGRCHPTLPEDGRPPMLVDPFNSNNGAVNASSSPVANWRSSVSYTNSSQSPGSFSRAGLLHPKVHRVNSVVSEDSANLSPTTENLPPESPVPQSYSPRRRPSFVHRASMPSTGSLPRSVRSRVEHDLEPHSHTKFQSHIQDDIRSRTMQLSEMLSPTAFSFQVPLLDSAEVGQLMQDLNTAPHNGHDHDLNSTREGTVTDADSGPFNPPEVSASVLNSDSSSSPFKSGLSMMLRGPSSPRPLPDAASSRKPVLTRTDEEAFRSGSPTPVPTRLHSPSPESPRRTETYFPTSDSPGASSTRRPPPQLRQRSIKWDPKLDAQSHTSRPVHHVSPPPDPELQPLLLNPSRQNHDQPYGSVPSPTPVAKPDLKKLSPRYLWSRIVKKTSQTLTLPSTVKHTDFGEVGKDALKAFPAVMLGCLLNILDGVSYGMLIFPTSEPFTDLSPVGVSLFFITAVVAQFTYTLGGSGFGGANGSMMIEVVPFFHILAQTIASEIGVEKEREVIATTLSAYMISSLLTGLAFLLLGALKLGVLIGFFPRHILVGCIGGVGVFLIQTGFTVALRIPDDSFAYNWDLFKLLFLDTGNLVLWAVPAVLALVLRLITMRWKGQLVFPIYFVIIPIVFYVVVAAARLDLNDLRRDGWIFEVGGGERNWWEVYGYFDIKLIHWGPLWDTLPTQFALLFFNILHPPLNVPALSVSLDQDINTNKELVGHGYSNLLAGAFGTIPNYLVYVNTLLFYRVGGNTRIAGFMLGIANMVLLWIGAGPMRYLPVCVVGTLIFVLGWDLVKEAVWDTRGRVSKTEFITIASIMVAMTVWDFVIGVLFGIIVSCFFFVIQNSQRRSIRSLHTGETVMSTVRRPSSQRAYIKEVSKQTTILRLQGFLFFGTITYVEEAIQKVVNGDSYRQNPVRFLVLDLSLVVGLDMSSAEAFVRVHRLLRQKGITMVFCGFRVDSEIGSALRNVEVLGAEGVELFEGFGDAIEWTENCYLRAWFRAQKELVLPFALPGRQDVDVLSPGSYSSAAGSPRRAHLNDVGFRTIANDLSPPGTPESHPEPYNTLVKVFSSFGGISSDHILSLMSYLHRMFLPEGHVLWKQGDGSDGLYVIESGVLRASYQFSMHSPIIEESMVSGTLAGELSGLSDLDRNATVWVERDAVVWKLSKGDFDRMERENPGLEMAVFRMVLKSAKVDYDILLSALVTRQ